MWNHQRLRSSVALVSGDFASSPALPLTSKLTQGDSLHFSGNGVLIYKIELFFEDL